VNSRQDRRLVFLLNVAQRRLLRWVAARTEKTGLQPPNPACSSSLVSATGFLMGEAGTALDLGPPGISGLVDRMTAADLIKRRADPDDGRAWRLWLTPAGRGRSRCRKPGFPRSTRASLRDSPTLKIDIVARWLTNLQTRFPRGEDE